MRSARCATALLLAWFLAMPVWAAEAFVFPNAGQSNEQLEKDKSACYEWAKGQTGFDPMKRPTATSAAPEERGGAVGGAARGALIGVAAGAIAGDAGKGAAIGALSGLFIGGIKRSNQQAEYEQWQRQQAYQQQQVEQSARAQYQQRQNAWGRAFGACMTARNYTVQ